MNPRKIKKVAPGIMSYSEYTNTTTSDENRGNATLDQKRQIFKEYFADKRRFDFANISLEKRNLIKIKKHESESDAAGISLTIEGYDVCRKYSSWWGYTGLWFKEYKDHWIMLILGVLGGVLGSLLLKIF